MATNNKYDRQLRLWGESGQAALANASILVINASAVGSETLKNLVLPGLGAFTILDPEMVQQSDLGNNFFVTADRIGHSRAKAVMEMMLEMNPDVKGSYRLDRLDDVMASDPAYFLNFDLVIATQLDIVSLRELAALCERQAVPLLVGRSYGLLGYVRIVAREHTILDSKPDPRGDDLRIDNPFPALQAFVDSFDFAKLSSIEYAHIPFVVILIQAIQRWKASHTGKLPSTLAEKEAFKSTIRKMSKTSSANFVEAVDNAYKAYVVKEIPPEVAEVLDHPNCQNLSPSTANFWIMARALKEFVSKDGKGQLPLSGHLPDMTATTEWFVEMQQIYKKKAAEDRSRIGELTKEILLSLGLPSSRVTQEELENFCKNASVIQCLSTRSFAEELASPNADELRSLLLSEPDVQHPALWYLMLRLADEFYAKHQRYPGTRQEELAADAASLYGDIKVLWKRLGLEDSTVSEHHAHELVRYGACELHNIAAIVGGLASQEAVKLITGQYVPLNNTYLFNGITATAAVFEA